MPFLLASLSIHPPSGNHYPDFKKKKKKTFPLLKSWTSISVLFPRTSSRTANTVHHLHCAPWAVGVVRSTWQIPALFNPTMTSADRSRDCYPSGADEETEPRKLSNVSKFSRLGRSPDWKPNSLAPKTECLTQYIVPHQTGSESCTEQWWYLRSLSHRCARRLWIIIAAVQ